MPRASVYPLYPLFTKGGAKFFMAYQIHLPTDLQTASNISELAALCAERDRLAARWNKGLDFLEDLRERKGQDCPEFEHWFVEWEKIDAQYKRVCDQIDLLELTAHMRQSSGVPHETKRPAIPNSANLA